MANYKLTQTGAEVQSDLDVVENLVDAFSTQLTYSRGELVIYNSNLYVCHTAVSSAGSWTGSTNWTETDLETLLEGKQTLLSSGTNIKTINGNSVLGSGDLDTNSNLANTYSSSSAYSVGSYVIYNHQLYKCKTAIASGGEAWNSAHWDLVKVGSQLTSKQDALDDQELYQDGPIYNSVVGFNSSANLCSGQVGYNAISSTGATNGQVLTADGSGNASWQPVIPTVVIALSQIVSQDPLEAQLTDAQYNIFANNKQVVLDLSALGQPNVVWQLQIDGSSYMCFGFISAGSGTTLDSNLIDIDKSTKVVTYYNNTIAGGGMDNPMTTAGDIIVGDADGTPTRLGKGNNGYLLGVNASGNLAYTNDLPYLTTAPSANNTSGLKIVVLSSEPATRYSGYLYIILGS